MASNYVQPGDVLDLVAPYDVDSGDGFLVNGNIFAVALGDAVSGAAVRGQLVGVWDLLAEAADTFAIGANVYWDDVMKRAESNASANTLIGVATKAKENGDLTVRVRLNGVSV